VERAKGKKETQRVQGKEDGRRKDRGGGVGEERDCGAWARINKVEPHIIDARPI